MITLTQVGKLHIISKWSLVTSLIMNCVSLWRISIRRSHSTSWMCPPQKPSTNTLGTPIREWECWRGWPGGHLSERGRLDSLGQPSPSPTPVWPDGGWVPQGPPPQPPLPAQPNPDMGHLINTLALGLQLGTPRINTFSGKATPGKTEVSFKQLNHEVQCIKDHYLESVVWESIVRSDKGAVADTAGYMGPTASVSDILWKLMVIFGMVASSDVLMQNFYKVTQGNHEKVPSFATRLEGTLNQIRLKCPRWIADHRVTWHLKDWLFHGVCKNIRDSIRYLHSNPGTTYSQLMVAACKVESEMEEAKDKVRARSTAPTEVVESSKELGNQIARLMATLTRAEQGNHPASAPNSPRYRGHARGQTDRNTPTCPSSHNGQTGLGQTTSACISSAVSQVNTVPQGRGNSQISNSTQNSAHNTRDPNSLQCFRCQGWGHMARECATPAKMLNKDGGPKGMQWNPPPAASNKPATFPSWPWTKINPNEGSQRDRQPEVIPTLFLNPDPIVQLVGCPNKAPVVIDGQEVTALIDLGAQVLSISTQFCEDLALPIQPLGQLLELEGMGEQPSHTLELWRLTSRFQGSEITTRMCCWLSPPWPTPRWYWSWWVLR